jgi:hypothetical protein
MEEVCGRENRTRALARIKANKKECRCGRDDRSAVAGAPETALASDPGTVVEWNLKARNR